MERNQVSDLRGIVIRPPGLPVKSVHDDGSVIDRAVDSFAVPPGDRASNFNAASNSAGSALPRARARLKIPLAARAESAYRGSAVASKMADNEHSTAPLGDSEESSVQYPPREAVPEVGQRAENDGKVSSVGSGEKPRDVFEQEPSGPNREVCDPVAPVEEQAGPGAADAGSLPGDGPVLAGDSSADEITYDRLDPPLAARRLAKLSVSGIAPPSRPLRFITHVVGDRDSGPVPGEDSPPPRVGLALADHPQSSPFQSEIEAPHSAEERRDIHDRPLRRFRLP